MRYRVGGSLAARIRHNAPRDPKDIDLEFVNFADANTASQRLSEFRGTEAGPFPHVLYFVEGEREDKVSITMAAMGIRHPGETRSQLTPIELNNENTRQGNRDFKHLPTSRYGNEQPAHMRRNSLVAGVLERFSYTLAEGKSDDKEDGAQLRSLLSGMGNEELARLMPEIRDHFNWDAIRSAPPETVLDSSSGEEDVSAASGSESDSESSSIASIGSGHAFAPARPRSVSDSSSEEDDVSAASGSASDSESSSIASSGAGRAFASARPRLVSDSSSEEDDLSVASGSASDSESSSAASGGAWHALASAAPHSVDDSSSEEDGVSVASRSDSDNESTSTTSSAAPATPLVINHEARMTGAMEYLGRLVAHEQTQRAPAR